MFFFSLSLNNENECTCYISKPFVTKNRTEVLETKERRRERAAKKKEKKTLSLVQTFQLANSLAGIRKLDAFL